VSHLTHRKNYMTAEVSTLVPSDTSAQAPVRYNGAAGPSKPAGECNWAANK
jgi:hypothetical protein